MDEDKDITYKVTDRRKFHSDGTPREQSAEPQTVQVTAEQTLAQAEKPSPGESVSGKVVSFPGEASRKREQAAPDPLPAPTSQPAEDVADEERATAVKAAVAAAEQAYGQTKAARAAHLPEPSFLALVDMLAGEAAMCLGLAQAPDGSTLPVDLDTARTMIDMLGMLDQKTKGNLTEEENNVLENVLAYLRMQFVELSRN